MDSVCGRESDGLGVEKRKERVWMGILRCRGDHAGGGGKDG